jgi:RimJ/RimL family protein N-acetyltransferase
MWLMKTGQILKEVSVKSGDKIVLRTPRWEDLDDLLGLINSVVDEGAEIGRDREVSREEEIDWLSGLLARLERGKTFFLVAEAKGRIIASSDINRLDGFQKHVGVVGIVIKNGFRELGIGTAMMNVLIEQAKKMGLEILTLTAFASNKRAIHVYEKVGFTQTGLIPRKHLKQGKYIDDEAVGVTPQWETSRFSTLISPLPRREKQNS